MKPLRQAGRSGFRETPLGIPENGLSSSPSLTPLCAFSNIAPLQTVSQEEAPVIYSPKLLNMTEENHMNRVCVACAYAPPLWVVWFPVRTARYSCLTASSSTLKYRQNVYICVCVCVCV